MPRAKKKKPKKINKRQRWAILNDAKVKAALSKIGNTDLEKEYGELQRDEIGRPTVITDFVILKLQQAFMIGCTDREACIYAGIAENTFYEFCKKYPHFREQKENWKDEPILASRLNIVRAIKNGSIEDSWKYLKSKRKDEFAEKAIVQNEAVITIEELEERASKEYENIIDAQAEEIK